MSATSQINKRLKLLPKELQEEVLQFIDYLLFKKKTSEVNTQDSNLIKESISPDTPLPEPDSIDYREFYGIIQPPMGLEKIDRLIAEMRAY